MKLKEDKSSELTKPSCESHDIARFLDLLEKDIEQHPDKLIVPSLDMKNC